MATTETWLTILQTQDQTKAKLLVTNMSDIRKNAGDNFNMLAECIGYPKTNVWLNGLLNPHFRRVLNELKVLAISGKTIMNF